MNWFITRNFRYFDARQDDISKQRWRYIFGLRWWKLNYLKYKKDKAGIHSELRKLYSRYGNKQFHSCLLSKEDKEIYDKYK